jgi:dTDP-4-amino-4,6-dideoxygalactose transaminase
VDKYTWIDIGSSYLPSDILAAFLYAQLEHRDAVLKRRRNIWRTYSRNLSEWAANNNVGLPCEPPNCEQPYHMFYLILPSLEARTALIEHLRSKGIMAVFHYVPLHLSEMGRSFGGTMGACPVTEWVSDRLVRLPFFNDITESEQAVVIEAITRFEAMPKAASASSPLGAA